MQVRHQVRLLEQIGWIRGAEEVDRVVEPFPHHVAILGTSFAAAGLLIASRLWPNE
jgi:hypothetical protein